MKNSAIDTQFSIFNESQIQAIKLIINKNFWGNTQMVKHMKHMDIIQILKKEKNGQVQFQEYQKK